MRTLRGLALVLGLSALGVAGRAEPLAVGAKAPAVTGTTEAGAKLDLGAAYAKGCTLVYFFPMAGAHDDTVEARSLAAATKDLAAKGVTVIGVSVDDPATLKAFKEKNELPFMLIADVDHAVTKAFGVPLSEEWGGGPRAMRQSFLVDKNGLIIWRTLNASLKDQPAEVLKALE